MSRITRFLLASSFVVAFAACSDEPDSKSDPDVCPAAKSCGDACCSAEQECIAGTCQTPDRCQNGQTPCGTDCCDDATEICLDDACQPKAQCQAGETPCGTHCCDDATETCADGACQAKDQCEAGETPCGTHCCDDATQSCVDDACQAKDQCQAGETPCGTDCCDDATETCADGACRAKDQCEAGETPCGTDCCDDATEICLDDACQAKPPECSPPCGAETPYCDDGTCKCQGASCGAGNQCNASGVCEPILVPCDPACDQEGALPYCDDGTCTCQGTSCGAGWWCGPSGACEELPCDPLDPTGCEAGEACSWSGSDYACGPAGTIPVGGACTLGECVPGADCFNPGVCRSYCSQTNPVACAAGDTCVDMGEGDLGVCLALVATCDPFDANPCPVGEGCYFDYFGEWDFVCRSAGTEPVGAFCYLDEFSCSPGLACVYEGEESGSYYGSCQQLCPDGDASSCSGGLATCEPMPEVGSPGYCATCPAEKTCGTVCCASYQSCVSGTCANEPCGVDTSLGSFTATGVVSAASTAILRNVPLPSADGTPDVLQIEIYDALAVGSFPLGAGIEANYATCNKCVRLFSRDSAGTTTAQYFATGGMLKLTSVTNGISAVLTNATFEQVDIASDSTSSPHLSGCTTAITSATVSGSVCAAASICGSSCCTATQDCNTDVVPSACVDIVTCDPLVPSSCEAGQACYWRAARFAYECGPAGSAAVGGTCTTFGQCVSGADCINNVCRTLCDTASPACTGGLECVASGRGAPGACMPPPPVNNLCAGAITLALGTPVSGETASATGNYGDPLSSGCHSAAGYNGAGPEVVYSYTPAASGEFKVSVTPSPSYDSLLWVSTAPCGDANACLNAADAGGSGGAETVTINGVAGTQYYIHVDSYSATSSSCKGAFSIEVSSPASIARCNPLDFTSCDAGNGCYSKIVDGIWAYACQPAGTSPAGTACSDSTGVTCIPGTDCVGDDTGYKCRPFCDPTGATPPPACVAPLTCYDWEDGGANCMQR